MADTKSMDAKSVLRILAALEAAGVGAVVDGGWGVDALLGEESREHGDLDLIAASGEAEAIRTALAALGYRPARDSSETNFVLADDEGREVDVHLVGFDERGVGSFRFPDGRVWPFPPAALAAKGTIGGKEFRCLSADAQVQCHGQGYPPSEKDLADMERLQERFGVVLPVALCRQSSDSNRAQRPAQSLGLVSLVVRDYDEAIAFYCDTLGFEIAEDTEQPEQQKRWVVVAPPGGDGARLLLARASTEAQSARVGDQTGGRVFLFLYTDDLDRDVDRYRSAGVAFAREPQTFDYGRVAVFEDLYGNLWDLIERAESARDDSS